MTLQRAAQEPAQHGGHPLHPAGAQRGCRKDGVTEGAPWPAASRCITQVSTDPGAEIWHEKPALFVQGMWWRWVFPSWWWHGMQQSPPLAGRGHVPAPLAIGMSPPVGTGTYWEAFTCPCASRGPWALGMLCALVLLVGPSALVGPCVSPPRGPSLLFHGGFGAGVRDAPAVALLCPFPCPPRPAEARALGKVLQGSAKQPPGSL